jgi:hypothetical protein
MSDFNPDLARRRPMVGEISEGVERLVAKGVWSGDRWEENTAAPGEATATRFHRRRRRTGLEAALDEEREPID